MLYGGFAYGSVELAGRQVPIVVPAPPANKRFTLFIAGVDRTSLMLVNTFSFTNNFTQISTCQFAIRDPTGAFHPTIGMDIQVFSNTTKVFGGTIDESTETPYQSSVALRADVKCSDYSAILDRRIVGAWYPGQVLTGLTTIVSGLVQTFLQADGITYNSTDGDPGISLGDQLFNWITARQAFNQLATATGWDFNIDYNKVLRFFPRGTGTGNAPFNIADNDGNVLAVGGTLGTGEGAAIRYFRGTYRNREYIRSSSQASALWSDIFSTAQPGPYPNSKQAPNGNISAFITLFPINVTPTIKVNGTPQRVIPLSAVSTAAPGSWDWYWIPPSGGFATGGSGVFQNQANARLQSSDVLEVDYQTALSPVTVATCPTQVTARAAAEGNSGFYDDVQDVSFTDPTAISNYATVLLNRYGCTNGIPNQVIYSTIKDGLFAGMLQTITLSQPLVPSTTYLITSVTGKDVDKDHIEYVITCDLGSYLGDNYAQFFAQIVQRGQMPQPANFETYVWQLAPSYPGITNPGLSSSGILQQVQTIKHPVEIAQYVSVVMAALPANPTITMQLYRYRDGSGVGTPLAPLVINNEVRYYFPLGVNSQKVLGGETYTVLIGGNTSSSAKDGTFTLVTSVSVA